MKNIKYKKVWLFAFIVLSANILKSQVKEPVYIGEAYILKQDSTRFPLDKEIADYTSGISWTSNSWNALSLEINERKAKTRLSSAEPLEVVVRAVDNDSDPLTIISIYKLKSKKRKRTVILSVDNSGTLMKSRTNSKDLIRFTGKKFGESSYVIKLENLKPGEYGIVVSNPNNRDEKRTVVSCFGVD